MEIISVINYKGGVGKTTVTANIAGELAFRGKKVLLVDMDAQASLTFSFFSPKYWLDNIKDEKTIKKWFDQVAEGKEPDSLNTLILRPKSVNDIVKNNGGVLDIISSHLGLINVDLDLATLLGGANLDRIKQNYVKVYGRLREAIRNVAKDKYDIVLIDCPPNFNIVTKNAIVASDKILIPAKPDYLSTLGIDYLKGSLDQLVREFNEFIIDKSKIINPEIMGIVFTMITIRSQSPISAQKQFIAQVSRGDLPVFKNYFRDNKTLFSSAPLNRYPVALQRQTSEPYATIVNEIEAVTTEFIEKIEGL
ncbi:ParA family protein [Morganella psychrotolerans]|uniref:Cobyrinic acid a,c-diamide synthase n=1 Tax=Morganella psychrotolerans TaxID=368603 RepID=A0A1B8HUL8_9GAMM|nr:AAA family ATPase [Morganella psychrotolerans]OBU13570.1 cobyrinic acid a,c-diamide synthase [Morganella psychrotolerans]